jgi:hypothetical protein
MRHMAGTSRAWRSALFVAAIVAACSSNDDGQTNGNELGSGGAWGALPTCGNGVVDQGEQCEANTPLNCAAATMNSLPNGTARCTGCVIDTSGCTSNGVPGAGGAPSYAGTPNGPGGTPVVGGGAGNVPSNTGGMSSDGGATSSGGTPAAAGGAAAGGSGSAGAPSTDGLEELRQVCTDEINRYRATLGLPALTRAPATTEEC